MQWIRTDMATAAITMANYTGTMGVPDIIMTGNSAVRKAARDTINSTANMARRCTNPAN